MYRTLSVVFAISLVYGTHAMATDSVKDMLQRADKYRLFTQSAKVITRVEVYKDERLDTDRLYHVYIKPGRRSLVVFKAPAEMGEKMLMLDDKFWLMLPGSKRAIRITATQKLLGEASAGDVATMTWAEDYDGQDLGSEKVDGKSAHKLELHSTRPGTTYDKIILWLRTENDEPIQAELYLASGKLAKAARYEMGRLDGRQAVVTTYLQDRIQTHRTTRIVYQRIEPAQIPDKYYNPAFLVTESLGSW